MYAERWQKEFNNPKCKVMHLGTHNTSTVHVMSSQRLVITTEEMDIGIMISRKLKPSAQCSKAARTA
jgi:hypothetical protein